MTYFWTAAIPDQPRKVSLTVEQKVYLASVQRFWPQFWRSLNSAWRSADPGKVSDWLKQNKVRDTWLFDVVRDTLQNWSDYPEGSDAILDDLADWYAVPHSSLPEFAPVFSFPVPRVISHVGMRGVISVRLETPDEFAARMHKQFRGAMIAYKRLLKRSVFAEVRAELFRDAEWTVLSQSGVSYAKIAKQCQVPGRDPVSAVRMAVRRFRCEIRLTSRAVPYSLSNLR